MKLDEINILGTEVTKIIQLDPEDDVMQIHHWFLDNGFEEISSMDNARSYAYSRPEDFFIIKFTHTPDPCYYRFVNFVHLNKTNPHLPKLTQIVPFQSKPNHILIGIEKLYPSKIPFIQSEVLWAFKDAMDTWAFKGNKHVIQQFFTYLDKPARPFKPKIEKAVAIKMFHENKSLFATMLQLRHMVESGCEWDLHYDNFMRRADGTLVIIDPLI